MTDQIRGYGCTDHGCVFGHPGGMGTNGGCKCLNKYEVRDNPEALHRIRAGIKALRAERDALRSELNQLEDLFRAVDGHISESCPAPLYRAIQNVLWKSDEETRQEMR